MEEQEYIETRPQPAFALLSFGEYFKLNHAISLAKGYDLSKKTQRVFSMNPPACKVDIEYDSEGNEIGYDIKFIAPISSELQIKYPTIINDYILYTEYIPVEQPIQEALVDITNIDTLYWTLLQFSVAGTKEDNLQLIISVETSALLTDDIITQIQQLGLNIKI